MASAIPHHAIRDAEDRSWTVRLVAAVGDPVTAPDERRAAVQTLGALEDFRAIPCLTSVLENTTLDEPTRRAASEALANSDDSTTTAARRDWWASGDGVLMRHALVASGNTDRELVRSVAGDDKHPLQAEAVEAMSFGFDDAASAAMVARALDHRDARVRRAAAQ